MLTSATITNTIRYIKLQQYAKIHIVQNKNTSRQNYTSRDVDHAPFRKPFVDPG